MRWWRVACIVSVLVVSPGLSNLLPTGSEMYHAGAAAPGMVHGFNVDAIGLDAPSRAMLFARIRETRFGWIRQQVRWSAIEQTHGQFDAGYLAQLDALVEVARANQVQILVSVVSAPRWAATNGGLPANPHDFAEFLRVFAGRYRGNIAAYEIWNEPNLATEVGGWVEVGQYLPVLRAGYETLKSVDPAVTVVFAGLVAKNRSDPAIAVNDLDYLRDFYLLNGGEGKRYYDVMGVHPGSACNPPDASYPDSPATTPCGIDADGNRSFAKNNAFYFKRFAQARAVMVAHGEGHKQLWMTEFGWDSTAAPPPSNPYARYVSEQQQATYIVRALEIGSAYPWVGAMFVWQLNFQVTTPQADEKYGWGVLNADWSPRPAFVALRTLL